MKNQNGHPDTLITLTSGKQDRGTRATLAFSWGCTALAMGQKVTIFMTMEGTIWAKKGAMKNVVVGGFEPLETYLEQFQTLGGELLVCAPCSEYYCSIDGAQLPGQVIPNAVLSGLATIVSRIGKETKTITF